MPIDIAKELAKQLKKHGGPIGVQSMTLTLSTPGTRTAGNLGGGTNPTTTAYPCSGFVEEYDSRLIDGTLVLRSDRKVSILGASVAAVPVAGARITVPTGPFAGTYTVIGPVGGDGVGAVYECQARK